MKKPDRLRRGQLSARRKEAAMRTLADLAANAKAEHVRAMSARALLNIDRPSAEADDAFGRDFDEQKVCAIIP